METGGYIFFGVFGVIFAILIGVFFTRWLKEKTFNYIYRGYEEYRRYHIPVNATYLSQLIIGPEEIDATLLMRGSVWKISIPANSSLPEAFAEIAKRLDEKAAELQMDSMCLVVNNVIIWEQKGVARQQTQRSCEDLDSSGLFV